MGSFYCIWKCLQSIPHIWEYSTQRRTKHNPGLAQIPGEWLMCFKLIHFLCLAGHWSIHFPTEAPTENRCMTVYDIESIFNNYFDTTFLLVWCFQSCLFQYLFWVPHAVFSQADTGASGLNWKVECPLHVLPFLCFTPYTHAHAYSVFTVDFWHVFLNSQKTSSRGCAIEHWLPSYQ